MHASAVALQSQQAGGAASAAGGQQGSGDAAASQDGSSTVAAEGEDADTISSSTEGSDSASAAPASSSSEEASKAEDADESGDVDVLHARIKELEGELDEAKNGRLRALADAETTRRIAQKDVEMAKNFSIQKFAKQLLDVSDNLQRALDHVPEEHVEPEDAEPGPARSLGLLRDGVMATRSELHRVFKGQGIEEFGEVGESFDPNKHEAMFMEAVGEGKEAGSVTQLLQTGFTFKDRVLRPAKVAATPEE